nr:ABC transporter permease subunit [Microbacterium sp. 69-10]
MRLIIGQSLFSIAIVSYIVRARLVGLDASLEEASADLYAPPFRTFVKVTLPLAMPAVLAGFLLSFTLGLDNTIVSAFVQVSGTTPWPVYVLSALRSGLRPEIAAVSTIMLVLTLASLALVAVVLKRAGDSATDIARTMAGG